MESKYSALGARFQIRGGILVDDYRSFFGFDLSMGGQLLESGVWQLEYGLLQCPAGGVRCGGDLFLWAFDWTSALAYSLGLQGFHLLSDSAPLEDPSTTLRRPLAISDAAKDSSARFNLFS